MLPLAYLAILGLTSAPLVVAAGTTSSTTSTTSTSTTSTTSTTVPAVCGDAICVEPDELTSCPEDCGCAAGCGVQAPLGCYCDSDCLTFGDCCDDACSACSLCSGPDHYMFYKVKTNRDGGKFYKFGPVRLVDQFSDTDYDIVKPTELGLPADKNGEGVTDEDTHLKEYQIKPVKGSPKFQKLANVEVANQCNDLLLEVTKPVSVLLPTNKDLSTLPPPPDPSHDHFVCYKVKAQKKLADGTKLPPFPKGIQVDVEDQFQERRYDLKKVTKLCLPVLEKSGTPTVLTGPDKGTPHPITPSTGIDLDTHLLCYTAKIASKFIDQAGCGPLDPADKGIKIDPKQEKHEKVIGFLTNNQFGPEQLDSKKEVELCIPSLKSFVIPAVCGDGTCEFPEDSISCPADCTCGDGVCDGAENDATCPADCGCASDPGLCGVDQSTAGGCYCDELCPGFGDCCADVCDVCTTLSFCP